MRPSHEQLVGRDAYCVAWAGRPWTRGTPRASDVRDRHQHERSDALFSNKLNRFAYAIAYIDGVPSIRAAYRTPRTSRPCHKSLSFGSSFERVENPCHAQAHAI